MVHIDPNLIYATLAVIAALCILLSRFGPTPNKNGDGTMGSGEATIKSVVFNSNKCQLDMKVEAGHTTIVEELPLPEGTWISDIKKNRLYLVEVPVNIPGNEMSESDVFQTACDLARAIGYTGSVRRS